FYIDADDFALLYCYDLVADPVGQQFRRLGAHDACHDAVTYRGGPAALYVPKYGGPCLDPGDLFYFFRQADSSADSFGNYDDVMFLAPVPAFKYRLYDILVEIEGPFRQYDHFGAAGDPDVQGYISCMPSHDFEDAAAFVRIRRVPYLVEGVLDRIEAGIIAYCVLGAADIIVYGAGYAHHL